MNLFPLQKLNKSKFILLSVSAFLLISCTEDSNENNVEQSILNDSEVESSITISQGIYGITTSSNDVGGGNSETYPEFNIDIFTEEPSSDLDIDTGLLVSLQSDDNGFYEVELEIGDYYLCSSFRRCITVSINENDVSRHDYDFGAGPGWL